MIYKNISLLKNIESQYYVNNNIEIQYNSNSDLYTKSLEITTRASEQTKEMIIQEMEKIRNSEKREKTTLNFINQISQSLFNIEYYISRIKGKINAIAKIAMALLMIIKKHGIDKKRSEYIRCSAKSFIYGIRFKITKKIHFIGKCITDVLWKCNKLIIQKIVNYIRKKFKLLITIISHNTLSATATIINKKYIRVT